MSGWWQDGWWMTDGRWRSVLGEQRVVDGTRRMFSHVQWPARLSSVIEGDDNVEASYD